EAVLLRGGAQPGQDVGVKAEHVPVEPVRQSYRAVAEPVDLGQREVLPPDLADDHTCDRRPEVDRGQRDHRRNAAATPESTGMCSPVVCARSPAVSAKTAAATCSGSTSCPSSVRLA